MGRQYKIPHTFKFYEPIAIALKRLSKLPVYGNNKTRVLETLIWREAEELGVMKTPEPNGNGNKNKHGNSKGTTR
jgi:hypothetical protein